MKETPQRRSLVQLMEDAFFREALILMLGSPNNENKVTTRIKPPPSHLFSGVDERSAFVFAASSGRQGLVIRGLGRASGSQRNIWKHLST